MSKRNRNRGGRGQGRRASRRNGNNPFGLSRRQRRDLREGVLWYSEWLKAQKNQNQKNVNRRAITEKVKKGQEKILDVLDKVATKLDQMLALFVKSDKREKKREEKKKHEGLAKKWWKSKSTGEKIDMLGKVLAAGTAIAGLAASLLVDDEEVPLEEQRPSDEAPKPTPPGVTDIKGAKLVIGKGVNLDGLNKDFLDRFLAAVREYQSKTGKIVRVNDGYRTKAEQQALVDKDIRENGKRTKTAEVGHSMHEYGFALDANSDELGEMERMGILKKYNLGRTQIKRNDEGKLIETWHLEDLTMQHLKKKLLEKGSDSKYAQALLKYHGSAGLPDESDDAMVEDTIAQKTAAEVWNAMTPLLMAQAAPTTPGPILPTFMASGGTVEVIAGEAGPELVLPMDRRGSEILANSVREAFVMMSRPRRKGHSADKFAKFFETTFLPELKKRMSG